MFAGYYIDNDTIYFDTPYGGVEVERVEGDYFMDANHNATIAWDMPLPMIEVTVNPDADANTVPRIRFDALAAELGENQPTKTYTFLVPIMSKENYNNPIVIDADELRSES